MNKKASRIPYRESKMTRILSLGQNKGLTVMILNLAPTRAYHLDTISSLNFASRTKKIEIAEVENDPMYRTAVKPLATTSSVGGATMARQPLRPLAAVANANLADAEKKKGEKPVKAFSVYSDTRKPAPRVPNTAQNTGIRRTEPPKRAAEPSSSTFGLRPTKTYRAADNTSRIPGRELVLTKASIEALIAQKVDERLAEKALQDAGTTAPALSAELQKRLDELEHRIDAKEEDGKSQGLQFLLMAKQHHIRGEDASALRMYQLAQPFFPDNTKLESKMKTLEDRIRAKRVETTTATRHVSAPVSASVSAAPVDLPSHTVAPPAPTSSLMGPLKAPKPKPKPKPKWATKAEAKDDSEDDEEFALPPPSDHEDSYASDDSFQHKPKAAARKPKKTTRKLPIFRDDATTTTTTPTAINPAEQTPRTSQLLKIINSRDVIKIKALKGVGAKKADSIVNCLMEMDDAEIMDLESLAMLKGVGGKTVDNMRLGLSGSVDYDF